MALDSTRGLGETPTADWASPPSPGSLRTARRASAVHVHRGTRAIQRMVELAPATGSLALWIRHQDLNPADTEERERVPRRGGSLYAVNDGATIFYGPDFDELDLDRQVGLVAHQVLHVALRHPQRRSALERLVGDVDRELFGICADAIVNSSLAHLPWLKLPEGSVYLDELLGKALNLYQPVEKALLEWDLERLYRALDDRRPRQSKSGKQDRARDGSGSGGQGRPKPHPKPERTDGSPRDEGTASPRADGPRSARARALGARVLHDLAPAAEGDAPEAEAERTREWAERLIRAHAGDAEFSMLRVLPADLPQSRTPWELVLRRQLARGLSVLPDLSWSRPSRSYLANRGRAGPNTRLPWEPGRTASRRVPRLAVIVDTSGSVDQELLGRFAHEIESMSMRMGTGLTVVIGDLRVHRVATFKPGRSNLRDIAFEGGGGTDFGPLLEEADRHAPDMGVVLTDLDGPADFCPHWPVIWAVPPEHESAQAPFGFKLVLR